MTTSPENPKGNYVSEWFGHRVFPRISNDAVALSDQKAGRCPFLSDATGEIRDCVKAASSSGVCTVSSSSNGPRQDWLVCPYRAIVPELMESVVQRLFSVKGGLPQIVPAPAIARHTTQDAIKRDLGSGKPVIVYLQDKLGGEISIPSTERSPELAIDITLSEIRERNGKYRVERFGILEVQTMDYHGTYRYVV
jgi:hypothetical protein